MFSMLMKYLKRVRVIGGQKWACKRFQRQNIKDFKIKKKSRLVTKRKNKNIYISSNENKLCHRIKAVNTLQQSMPICFDFN